MLGILLLIGIASLFVKYAKAHNLKPWLWGLLSIVDFFAAQFVAGIIIGLLAPNMLYDEGSLIIVGLISGLIGLGITYIIMANVAKKTPSKIVDEEILDATNDDEFDKLLEE